MNRQSDIDSLNDKIRESFALADQVRSFGQFLEDFRARPAIHLRTAVVYLVDMFDFHGQRESSRVGRLAVRYRAFDSDESSGEPLLVGQERVQEELYKYLLAFAKRGKGDKMLLLHGPNGSGKTTLVDCLIRGLEHYSETEAGQLLKFNWVFTDRDGRLDRIGFERESGERPVQHDTYAFLDPKDISAKFRCELRDSPLFLIPREHRRAVIEAAIQEAPDEHRPRFPYDFFLDGDLCNKCRRIYDALLVAYQGDWKKVLRHIQVERFTISKRYRVGAVSIEPQVNIDAGARAIMPESSWSIPGVLRNVALYEPVGDIIDANRGLLEYSDFLKRPVEASKYLLTTCERGTASLPNCLAFLDLVIVGTTNEKQLSLFKGNPDFSSFKGRIELIHVPYLLRPSVEVQLYKRHIDSVSRERHVTPHAAEVAALWAVLTRLRRPDPRNYTGTLSTVVGKLTPIEKARLYDNGEVPTRFNEEERKALRAGILEVRGEFEEDEVEFEGIYGAEYEGRRGVSAREMLMLLGHASQAGKTRCLTPMAVFDALAELIKEVSFYDFLRLPEEGGYRNVKAFIDDVRNEYFRWVTEEVYDSIHLIEESEYDRFFLEYFRHVKAFHTKEQVYNQRTGGYDAPNEDLMHSVERLLTVREPKDQFRSHIIRRIAAWSLDHPHEKINYQDLFPEIYGALRDNFYRERNRLLTLIERDMLKHGTDEFALLSAAEQKQVLEALESMRTKYGYCEHCARDVIAFVLKHRPAEET